MKKKQSKFITNSFYHYGNEYRKFPTDESELEKIDMTEMFWKELFSMIKMNELINMNINAPPTMGKSTVAMAIAKVIMKKAFKKSFGIRDIDRDQQEFSQTMRSPKIENTIRVIDEWNEMEETGENSTVETALLNYISDVMAQRFVHKISCSPKEDGDKNALIYLEVISTDKVNKMTHCKLYYKIFSGGMGMEIKQLLGFVSISVKDVLKSKWYIEYRRRKFEKMDLMLKEGISKPRILGYAGMILNTINKLKNLTKVSNLIDANIVRNYIKMEARKNKFPLSIVGESLATSEALGVLNLYKNYWKVLKERAKIKKSFDDNKIDIKEYKGKEKELETATNDIALAMKTQEEELERYKKIHEEYDTIRI